MIKSELIAKIAMKLPHLPEQDITLCVNTVIDNMMQHLTTGGRIEIRDFGTFDLNFHPSRLARNPKTGEKLITDPKNVVHFKPGKGLKTRINTNKQPIKEARETTEE